MGKADKLDQAAANEIASKARRLPPATPISEGVWSQGVVYVEQAFGRGQAMWEFREKAEVWVMMWSLFIIPQALKTQTELLKSWVWVGTLGVHIQRAEFHLLCKKETYWGVTLRWRGWDRGDTTEVKLEVTRILGHVLEFYMPHML